MNEDTGLGLDTSVLQRLATSYDMTLDALVSRIKDPKFYLENFVKVKNKKGEMVPFILNEAQKDFLNAIRKNNRVIALKCRQIGFSTITSGYIYHQTITRPGATSALISYNADSAAEFLEKVKQFQRTTPEALRPPISEDSKYAMRFPYSKSKDNENDMEDSRIVVLSGDAKNVGSGYTFQYVLISELAKWENAEAKLTSLNPAIAQDSKLIIESTPLGMANYFADLWFNDNNGYEKREYPWNWIYTEEEADYHFRVTCNGDELKFAQEYSCSFLTSGRGAFDQRAILAHRSNILKPGDKRDIITIKNIREQFTVYKTSDDLVVYAEPVPGRTYVLGCDNSEGVPGGDNSCVIIFDRETGEEVAFYYGLMDPDLLGERINDWGRWYNNALVVVEINHSGQTTISSLKRLAYPSMYYRQGPIDKLSASTTDRIGWRTTDLNRPFMVDDFRKYFRDNLIIIHSKILLDEMTWFVYDDQNKPKAASGKHDDSIMATAVALQGFKQSFIGDLEQLDYNTQYNYANGY